MVPKIPRSAAEKVQRWRLTEQYTKQQDSAQQHVRDKRDAHDVLDEVQQAWGEELGTRPSHGHDNFFESGGGSMQAAALAINLSSRLSMPVESAKVFSCPEPELLAASVQQQMAEACSRVRLQPAWHATGLATWQSLNLVLVIHRTLQSQAMEQ